MSNKTTTAIIYARYSSDSQRDESIDGQIRECMEFAERNGINVVGSYIDRALSAKTDNRPEFQRMIKDSYKTRKTTPNRQLHSSNLPTRRQTNLHLHPP